MADPPADPALAVIGLSHKPPQRQEASPHPPCPRTDPTPEAPPFVVRLELHPGLVEQDWTIDHAAGMALVVRRNLADLGPTLQLLD